MHLRQRLALSAFVELLARYVREGKFTPDEIREINAVTQAARAAFDEPPPRSAPTLVCVSDPELDRTLEHVAAEMLVPA